MSDTAANIEMDALIEEKKKAAPSTASRLLRFSATKAAGLALAVVIGVYMTILIANMGGYVDEMRRGFIREQVSIAIGADQSAETRALSVEERNALIEEQIRIAEQRLGLDQPFMVRSFLYLRDALTLNLGRATVMVSDEGSSQVRLILLERLPPTLALWGVANLILFFSGLFIALFLSRRYGSFLDRAIIALAPTSAAPAWFYGLFLILFFAAILQILPFGAMVDAPPPETTIGYLLSLGKHLILPVTAIIISGVFVNAYN
jgi:peptide/nickel transport system permease protein